MPLKLPDFKELKMPDVSGVHMPDTGSGGGDDYTSIIIFVGVALLAFLIFRKLIKWAVLIGVMFMLFYLMTG